MKHYLLDTNVVLDLLLNRAPWASASAAIWEAHRHGYLRVSIAAFSISTIAYIVQKQGGSGAAEKRSMPV
jgi:predicted nucleic acid-binding protein